MQATINAFDVGCNFLPFHYNVEGKPSYGSDLPLLSFRAL